MNRSLRLRCIASALSLLSSVVGSCGLLDDRAAAGELRIESEETSLVRTYEEDEILAYAVSPDGCHLALARLCRDGLSKLRGVQDTPLVTTPFQERFYDRILANFVFSPDSQKVAFGVQTRPPAACMVINRTECEGRYTALPATGAVFSPDSRRFAYLAALGENLHVVVDNERQPAYDDFPGEPPLQFSPDSRRFLYAACKVDVTGRRNCFLVVDGREFGPYDQIRSPCFSPDGRQVAFIGRRGAKMYFVLDGEEHGPHDHVIKVGPFFGPEGLRVVYGAGDDGQYRLFDDGVPGQPYELITGHWCISSDGDRLAYFGGRRGRNYLVVDGKEQGSFDVVPPQEDLFSPDGRQTAFAAGEAGRVYVVVNGKKSQAYDDVSPKTLRFAPDNRRLAYVATRGRNKFVVVGDETFGPFRHVPENMDDSSPVVFSSDGKRFACPVESQDGAFCIVDGTPGKRYEQIVSPVVFGPDGRHYAYAAMTSEDTATFVIDGQEHGSFVKLLSGARIVFDGPNALHAIVLDGDDAKLIELELN